VEVLDLSDEAAETDIGWYLVPRLYAAAVIVGETIYEFLFESLRELLVRL